MVEVLENKDGFKKTKLGLIPENWELKSLNSVGEIFTGGTPSTSNPVYWNGEIIWYTPTEITKTGKYISDSQRKISQKGLDNSSAKLFPKNTIVVCTRATIGELAISKVTGCTNQGFKNLNVNSENSTDFIYYKLLSQKKQFVNKSCGSTFLELSTTDFRNFKIALPPLLEQQKIAEILSTWDDAIAKQEALIKQKLQLKSGLMQQLLTGEKRFVEFTNNWKEIRLGELGVTYSGLSGKTKEDFGQGKPYIPYMNIFSNPILDDEYLDYVDVGVDEKQNKAEYGDIFFTVSSETPDEVGMASVLLSRFDELYLNSFCFGFRLENFETLLPEFAAYYLRGELFRREMYKAAQGATRYNLSKGNVTKVMLILPDIEEQQKIASVLSTADSEIKNLQKQLDQLNNQKQGLMQQLLTGQVRVGEIS